MLEGDRRSQQEMRDRRSCTHSACASPSAAAMSAAVLVAAAAAACFAKLHHSSAQSAAAIARQGAHATGPYRKVGWAECKAMKRANRPEGSNLD